MVPLTQVARKTNNHTHNYSHLRQVRDMKIDFEKPFKIVFSHTLFQTNFQWILTVWSKQLWHVWRPKFLITVINANDRISRVKPVKHRSNLGQPGSSPRKPRHWTLLNPLTKPTHIRSRPLAKDTVETGLTVDVSESRPELLPRSPKFT
jgi:hypothetical protein